jgi:hypothetical protein
LHRYLCYLFRVARPDPRSGSQEVYVVEWVHPGLTFELFSSRLDYNAAQATLITGTAEEKELLLAKLNVAWMALPPYMCSATVSATGGLILRPNDTTPRICEAPASATSDNKEGGGQGKASGMAQVSARSAKAAMAAVLPGNWNNLLNAEVQHCTHCPLGSAVWLHVFLGGGIGHFVAKRQLEQSQRGGQYTPRAAFSLPVAVL